METLSEKREVNDTHSVRFLSSGLNLPHKRPRAIREFAPRTSILLLLYKRTMLLSESWFTCLRDTGTPLSVMKPLK